MSLLTKYKEKRNFSVSPEPKAIVKKKTAALSFVVQRHKASRLHYDFRLEMDGILKSWAVPKGPSMNPADKRLAMMVEDHPYNYKDFKGVIPEGYGAGIVEIWDNGKYTNIEEDDKATAEKKLKAGLRSGNLKFTLFGKKLKGEFALVKLKDGKQENAWLLIKHNDKYAVDTKYDSEKETAASSPINQWLSKNGKARKTVTPKKKLSKDVTDELKEKELTIGKNKVKLTNLNKIYFPDDQITKGMVIDYYQKISEYILPYLKDRPESLKRNPNGIKDEGFYHKDAGEEAPSWVKSFKVYSESAKKDIDYILCNDAATLAYLNNLGCIEINPWNSTIKKVDNPDYMIIDIDPSEKNTFEQVIEAANVFKEILDQAQAKCLCKTSGATGLHIYVPMGKKYTYEQVKDFAHLLCTMVSEQLPEFTTTVRNLQKRGNKNIYLDYLQNRRGQTLACAYSLRPRKGATVSTPLEWKEVKSGLTPAQFTIDNIFDRIKKKGDIFKEVLGPGIDLKKSLDNISS